MNFLASNKQSLVPIAGVVMIVLGIELPVTAATLTPDPLFNSSASYSTTIPRNEGGTDVAEIYYPTEADTDSYTTSLPIALFLQGALVDKSDYSNFASTVARYGFVVVVPNHIRTAMNPMGSITGFIAEQQQVNDVLTYMVAENSNPSSPISGLLDSDTLVLLGHSFGGAVGLAAIQDNCFPVLCTGQFNRPNELKGGAFFGTNFLIGQGTGLTSPIDNDGIPIALIQGSLDSVATPSRAEATYSRIQDSPK
ncbi:MAG TPA: chlorophyllase, partial [Coleofasciculaceae cyanobacterium]